MRLRPGSTAGGSLHACPHRRTDTTQTVHAMNLLTTLIGQIPIYTLHCLPDEGAVTALYDTLTQGGLL